MQVNSKAHDLLLHFALFWYRMTPLMAQCGDSELISRRSFFYNRCHRDPDAQMPEGNPAIPGKENK
jgi:hypothetical protein